MLKLLDEGWGEEFTDALRADDGRIRIICPFIKVEALKGLLLRRPRRIQVITRFSLSDFADGVSDAEALGMLLNVGARVRGVKNLHAKLYLFGESRAIITSANLTEAALYRNHEFGMVTDDAIVVKRCRSYFKRLWQCAGSDLRLKDVRSWNARIQQHQLLGGRADSAIRLEDLGADVGITKLAPVRVPMAVTDASQAFVKFQGNSKNRVDLSVSTIEELKSGGCHWAVCYSANKRPRQVENGDVVFIGRFTRAPNDIRVFGRATGMAYKEGRDDATEADIELRDWKRYFPHYIRVHSAEFVDGEMSNGVSLNELMDTLEENSFATTQLNAMRGEGNTDPRKAYSQQGAVRLSADGQMWLAEQLQSAFQVHGTISQNRIDQLDWPTQSVLDNGF